MKKTVTMLTLVCTNLTPPSVTDKCFKVRDAVLIRGEHLRDFRISRSISIITFKALSNKEEAIEYMLTQLLPCHICKI